MATNLTDANYYENVENLEGVSIVQFTAPWCGPCRMLAPRLQELADETGITYFKVNIDENSDLARDFQIMSIPTLKVYANGQEVRTLVGVKTRKELDEELKDYL